jgi:hypothetical protein
MYTALQLIKDELKNAREVFEGTVADVTEEQLHKDPGGKALPLGSVYAHLIFSEDVIIHGMLQGKAALADSTWKEKTGTSEPMPPMDEHWSTANNVWAKKVKIDLKQLREYAKAVYTETDAYVASLKDEDLEREIDLGAWGKQKIAYMMYGFIIGHTFSLAGEISALKGLQGAKGYPF